MISLLLAASAAAAPMGAAPAGDTLRFVDEVPTTLNPLYAATLADVRAQALVYDWLFSRGVVT